MSEHQPTTWVSFFFDLHILVCTFPAGLWFCIKNINDERVFGKAPERLTLITGRRRGPGDRRRGVKVSHLGLGVPLEFLHPIRS